MNALTRICVFHCIGIAKAVKTPLSGRCGFRGGCYSWNLTSASALQDVKPTEDTALVGQAIASPPLGDCPKAGKEVSFADGGAQMQVDILEVPSAVEIPVTFGSTDAAAESSSIDDKDAAPESSPADEDSDEEKDGSWVDVSDEEPKVSSKGKGPLKASILEAVDFEAEAELLRNRGSVYSSDSE